MVMASARWLQPFGDDLTRESNTGPKRLKGLTVIHARLCA